MSAEYTPTTEDVVTAALAGGIYSEAEIDRWLAGERRKTWADAWVTGYNDRARRSFTPNPHEESS